MSAERYCPTHEGHHVLDGFDGSPICELGHHVAVWSIVRAGVVIGWGHEEHGGHIIPGALPDIPTPEEKACPKGHVGAWITRADTGKERCSACHRETNLKYQANDTARKRRRREEARAQVAA